MSFIKMGKEIARDEGVLLGKWMGGDSCISDNTGGWAKTDCTMAHRSGASDIFGVGESRGYYRVTETNSSQHIRKDLTHALTVDRVYKILFQYRTNTAMQYNGGCHLDLKSSGDGSGGSTAGTIPSSTIIDSLPGWTQLEFNYTAIVASDEMRLLLWLETDDTLDWRQYNVYEALIP